jgi:asparagine synthase (glutamine-hydrolysing)
MCGIAGFIGPKLSKESGNNILQKMGQQIVHRGPDAGGIWFNEEESIGFSHRRLSIVDLTIAGAQPMISNGGRYTIVFNGEIYNHNDIRQKLLQTGVPSWKGHSDTETLLAGIEAWGLEATLQECIGMFAIALWDNETKNLSLARDRMGEKPLYYGWKKKSFLFASELKAIKQHPDFDLEIDRDALCLFMRYSYIPAPFSIYKGISKLTPGCILTLSANNPEPVIKPFWSLKEIVVSSKLNPFRGSSQDAVIGLEKLLLDSVSKQLMSDVPLGAFLSGGIDSSTIVALMQAQSSQPIKTFSIGFEEALFNEAEHAKAVASHLGTDHTELYVTAADSLAVIPQLPELYDEPFADPSQIPTYLVAKLAKKHVTVSLSGDAGDELFAGYNRYSFTSNSWKKLSVIPNPIRVQIANALQSLSPNDWNNVAGVIGKILPKINSWKNIGDKLQKGARVMSSKSVSELYLGMVSHWDEPENIVINGKEPQRTEVKISGLNDIETMMAEDILSYLPDDILCKVDRAAMGVSLETRVPFLDHRVIEYAWSLPYEYKLRNGHAKWVLKQVLYKYVPPELIDRPKMGFGVPIDSWLRGPLREWAEELLEESRLREEGFFNPIVVRQKWREHLSGQRNWQYQIWNVLMFQAWLENS